MINNDLKLLIIDDDVDIVRLFLENQQPDNDQLNQLIKLTINENKTQCLAYLFSLPHYEEFISYYDLLSYSSRSGHLDTLTVLCSNPSSDMQKCEESYLYLLLGLTAQTCYEAVIYLLEHIYIGQFKDEHIQAFLNESFNTVIRNVSMHPTYSLKFDDSDPEYHRVVSCMHSLYELGAVLAPYSSQTISPDMQKILDHFIFNQQLNNNLPQQESDAKPKL